jgi:xanthine dehydrogenase accessory factor
MHIFSFIHQQLIAHKRVLLLYVVNSNGSSPGRAGFKMAIASDNSFCGTIGGGIMEFKLVEKAKSLLQKKNELPFLQQQFHDKSHAKNSSGMICSGSQTVAFIPLENKDEKVIASIIANEIPVFKISNNGIESSNEETFGFSWINDKNWSFVTTLVAPPKIYIIGGGHCSLALSQVMKMLGFYITLFDDREQLNTIDNNIFANEKHLIHYENIDQILQPTNNDFIVIMTVGYRTDKIVLKKILNKSYKYLGLLGSQHKINVLFAELINEGVSPNDISKINAPIGINIASKTTHEIAISIAAQIVEVKNKR